MRRRVTILDVAAQAGVSDETRARILSVAEQLGWVPSLRGRSLSGKRAYPVGLVIERPSSVIESDPFLAGFLAGVEVVLSRKGYALVALDHRIDGAFLTDVARNDARVPMLQDLELPAVAVNPAADCGVPAVRQTGLRSAVSRLARAGC